MAPRIILDANIILDLTLQRTDDLEDIKMIYSAVVEGTCKCYITTSIIHICGHWLKKTFDTEQVKKILLSLLNHVTVIDATHDVIINALHSSMTDIEDAVQYYIALSHKIDFFISRDTKFVKSARHELPIYKPADFIKNLMC